jgi:hypothetical protein
LPCPAPGILAAANSWAFILFFSWLGAVFGTSESLHRARFARAHELRGLVSHVFEETSLLLGRAPLGRIYQVRPTPKRRELGNMLVVAPTRGGKGLLAVSQLLTWHHPGKQPVPIRWVLVRYLDGRRDPEAFLCTATSVSARDVLSWFYRRWSVETTYEEARAHLGVKPSVSGRIRRSFALRP